MIERRKKLIEVALPLEAINRESAREKSIRHGHPSTLHLWWARRPLAACRAVLFAQLVDDPDSDPAYRRADGTVDEDAAGVKRAQLFNLIEELVLWENSNNERVINAARAEIARCVASRKIETGELAKDTIIFGKGEGKPHPKGPLSGEFRTAWELIVHGHGDLDGLTRGTVRLCPPEVVNHFLVTYAPPVLDPFAGGGSIPLEAQRLGLRAYASDLNPVAVLINKALIEIPPKFANLPPVNPEARQQLGTRQYRGAEGLAEDVRYYGKWMRDEAEKRIGHLYPKVKITQDMAADRSDLKPYVGQELTVIAWLWARTVTCPNPACGAQLPLIGSLWLSKRPKSEAWLTPIRTERKGVGFRVDRGSGGPQDGTVGRRGATCLCCSAVAPLSYVREQGLRDAFGVKLIAIVAQGEDGRVFLPANDVHEAKGQVAGPAGLLDTALPKAGLGFRVQLYGLSRHRQLFSGRQLTALDAFCQLLDEARKRVTADALVGGPRASTDYSEAVVTYLALAVSKAADLASALCHWQPNAEHLKLAPTFMRPTLSMTWDFAEGHPFSDSTGSFYRQFELIEKVLCALPAGCPGVALQQDAQLQPTIAQAPLISTDPPYYDNIGYADLSDFFYVWLRRCLAATYPELLSTVLVPKSAELIADASRHGGQDAARDFFERGLRKTFIWMNQAQERDFPLTVFYAFKQAETTEAASGGGEVATASTGWEVMLEGLLGEGFSIEGTWPFRTERTGRPRSNASNALASSVVLVCRARPGNSPMASRREFLSTLKLELPEALRKLQLGNIAPVDLAQAAIGPGMGAFSRYAKVVESDGSAMTVRAALGLINQMLDEVLAEQEGEFDGDTRWAVAWFEQYGTDEGEYGVAETLSKAKNTSVQGLVEAGVVAARGGKVKLLGRNDMPEDWSPATDTRLTTWEATQYLIRALDQQGEQGAAGLLRQLGGGLGEMARDLSYRLYSICERKGWAQEALAYNSLVIAWSEITRLARAAEQPGDKKQTEMF
jgi:putative DNA methylase